MRTSFLFLFCLGVAGCGQTQIDGSYDITIADPASPSSGEQTGRLDVRHVDDHYEGVFTVRWGSPHGVDVLEDGDAITVSGLQFAEKTKLVLHRHGDAFAGTGELGDSANASVRVNVAHDATPPSISIDQLTQTAAMLPWDDISFASSEPLGTDPVKAIVATTDSGNVALAPTRWPVEDGTEWAGFSGFSFHLASWDVAGTTLSLHLPNASDRSGNVSGATDLDVRIRQVPGPNKTVTLDSLVTIGAASKAACEGGSCMRLGPISECTSPTSILAGRVDATGKKKLVVRYRVVSHDRNSAYPLAIRVVAPGAHPTNILGGIQLPLRTAVEQDEFELETDVIDAKMPLPLGTDVGFSLENMKASCSIDASDYFIDVLSIATE